MILSINSRDSPENRVNDISTRCFYDTRNLYQRSSRKSLKIEILNSKIARYNELSFIISRIIYFVNLLSFLTSNSFSFYLNNLINELFLFSNEFRLYFFSLSAFKNL